MLLLAMWFGCGGATCGEGTHLEDGTCVADEGEDTDDTDVGGYTGPCAPPDAFTGGVDAALYTTTPYDAGYDAGVADLIEALPDGEGSQSASLLVQNATVVAVGSWDESKAHRIYLSDGQGTVALLEDSNGPRGVQVGQKASFAATFVSSYSGERYAEHASGWTADGGGHPVAVHEVAGALPMAGNTFSHAYGPLDRVSAADCGAGLTCYVLVVDGAEVLVRLPSNNTYGLTVDYTGGQCAELVAPVVQHAGATGTSAFLDVEMAAWMRVWPE